MKPKIWLSKSSFLKGIQCHKALALHKFKYEVRDNVTQKQQALFDAGHKIEDIARQLHFPSGLNLKPKSPLQWPKVITMTENLINNQQERLYEAALQYKGVMCAFDVLDNHGNKELSIFEIKRNKKMKTVYLWDMSLQYWVVSNAGYKVKQICLVQPIEENEEITGFTVKDYTEMVQNQQAEVQEKVEQQFNLLLHKNIPDIAMGEHCNTPYRCSFYQYCKKTMS